MRREIAAPQLVIVSERRSRESNDLDCAKRFLEPITRDLVAVTAITAIPTTPREYIPQLGK